VWDASTGECLYTLEGHTDRVNSVWFSPDKGDFIVSGSADKTIIIWNTGTKKKVLSSSQRTYRFQ